MLPYKKDWHKIIDIFTALHGMQTRPSDEKAIRLSPLYLRTLWRYTNAVIIIIIIKCVDCDKMEERSVQIYTLYERSFSLVFWDEEWLVGAIPSTWNVGSTGPRWSESADFQPIFAGSASAVTSSEKSLINANRKSTTRFPMSLRWSSYVAPKSPKGVLKTQNGRFP